MGHKIRKMKNCFRRKKTQGVLPPLWLSILPLLVLVALIGAVVSVFGEDSLSGASQVALIIGTGVTVMIGIAAGYMTWDDFENALTEKIAAVAQALIILLLIGALGGAWMVSGIVPTLICMGMNILQPEWFLPSACVICALVSLMTGSSWTTIATIGIALLGIGTALGFHEGWVAGAIISGAYFGDKISPLSDTTVMASSTAGTPLFTHIRYMLRTTLPTISVTLVIYIVAGLLLIDGTEVHVHQVRNALENTFHLTPWLLIVPACTGILITRKMPALTVLFMSVIMACIAALITQRPLLYLIADTGTTGLQAAFRGMMQMLAGSTTLDTGVPSLNTLVATRGMAGMMSTVWLILCAMLYAAGLTASHMLESIMTALLRMATSLTSLVGSTALTGIFLNFTTSDQYMSIILTSSLFSKTYHDKGLEPRLLSRSVEDSATVTSVLIPWNSCGMTQSAVLGVSVLTYAPFCFFCYLSPITTVLAAGVLQYKRKHDQHK